MKVALRTSAGDIVIELDSAKAPATVENFVNYVKAGHYDGTIFHRVIKDFMIQGGGFTPDMTQKNANTTVRNEANNGLKNLRGTVAMARTNEPHSASAQFFINTVDNDFLNFRGETAQGWGYAVFGKVVEGMDTVDAIRKVRTGRTGMHQDVPSEAIVINKAEIIG